MGFHLLLRQLLSLDYTLWAPLALLGSLLWLSVSCACPLLGLAGARVSYPTREVRDVRQVLARQKIL